jgi:hypothetical protein
MIFTSVVKTMLGKSSRPRAQTVSTTSPRAVKVTVDVKHTQEVNRAIRRQGVYLEGLPDDLSLPAIPTSFAQPVSFPSEGTFAPLPSPPPRPSRLGEFEIRTIDITNQEKYPFGEPEYMPPSPSCGVFAENTMDCMKRTIKTSLSSLKGKKAAKTSQQQVKSRPPVSGGIEKAAIQLAATTCEVDAIHRRAARAGMNLRCASPAGSLNDATEMSPIGSPLFIRSEEDFVLVHRETEGLWSAGPASPVPSHRRPMSVDARDPLYRPDPAALRRRLQAASSLVDSVASPIHRSSEDGYASGGSVKSSATAVSERSKYSQGSYRQKTAEGTSPTIPVYTLSAERENAKKAKEQEAYSCQHAQAPSYPEDSQSTKPSESTIAVCSHPQTKNPAIGAPKLTAEEQSQVLSHTPSVQALANGPRVRDITGGLYEFVSLSSSISFSESSSEFLTSSSPTQQREQVLTRLRMGLDPVTCQMVENPAFDEAAACVCPRVECRQEVSNLVALGTHLYMHHILDTQ